MPPFSPPSTRTTGAPKQVVSAGGNAFRLPLWSASVFACLWSASFRQARRCCSTLVTLKVLYKCFCKSALSSSFSSFSYQVWWGEPYQINQVIWIAAAIVVPSYYFINLQTFCAKDGRWALPFKFAEGLRTARQIKLEDERQIESAL